MNFKRFGIAAVMAIVLFVYGWFLSTAGHDHASHEEPAGGSRDSVLTSHDHEHAH